MKPGDHPDFFRLPPPAGRSRESKIVLDAKGRFFNDGVPIEHGGMAAAFASWIRRHPDDGRFILTNRYDWTYFAVEDVPFFVRGLSVGPRGVVVRLSDGTEEELDASTLCVGDADAVYARVKGGEFEAKFVPAAQSSLVELVVEMPDGRPGIEVAGRRFALSSRCAVV
jgi:hypothetical protein